MSDETVKVPGQHYSGKNKIPTVNQFLERLDKDKKERDKQIDQQQTKPKNQSQQQDGEAVPHQEQQLAVKGSQKKVTDPTTGREVVIEDVNQETMNNAKNPVVSLSVCALMIIINVPTVIRTKRQSWQGHCMFTGADLVIYQLLTRAHSPSKPMPLRPTTNTRRSRISPLLPTLLNQVPHQMCLFMERRRTSYFIPPPQSAMSPTSPRWRRKLAFSVSVCSSVSLYLGECLEDDCSA